MVGRNLRNRDLLQQNASKTAEGKSAVVTNLRKRPSRTTRNNNVFAKPAPKKSSSRNPPQIPTRKLPNRRISKRKNPVIETELESEDSDANFKSAPEKLKDHVWKTVSSVKVSEIQDISPTKIETVIQQEKDYIDRMYKFKLPISELYEFSDEDDSKNAVVDSPIVKKTPTNFEGVLLILQFCFLTIFPIAYFMFCNEIQCSLTKLPNLSKFQYLSNYIDGIAFAISLGYGLIVVLTSAIPFGGVRIKGLSSKRGKLIYTMNGLFVAATTLSTLAILEFSNVPIIEIILKKYFQTLISLMIIGIVLSFWLYNRSQNAPLSALKADSFRHSKLHNYVMGRELNPRLFETVDVKMCLIRFFLIGTILMNGIFLYKDIQIKGSIRGKYNLTLIFAAGTQIVYFLDYLIFEPALVTTASVQYDAPGCTTSIFSCYGCLLICATPKYIYDYGVKLPLWYLIITLMMFACGYILFRASNNQKNAFRKNPYSPNLSHLETISTSRGTKLLISGYWGWVRHPNYLGDIIVNVSFAMYAYNVMPLMVYIVIIAILFQRAEEDGLRCKQKYGFAWERYCERVKYVLIPKVY